MSRNRFPHLPNRNGSKACGARLRVRSELLSLLVVASGLWGAGLWSPGAQAKSSESPLAVSAEYYLQNREFERSLELYRQLIESNEATPKDWERASLVVLYVEGRSAAQDLVQKYFAYLAASEIKRPVESLESFLNSLYSTFLTDRSQALFLQGKVRADRGDCEGAVVFYRQALDLDPNHLRILEQQISCEMRRANYSAAYDALKAAHALHPLSLEIAESAAEMHLYFGSVTGALEVVANVQNFRSLSPRLQVAQAVALARKTDREAAWLAFKKMDNHRSVFHNYPILFWEKAKLLETDPRRKSPLAKSQLAQWLRRFVEPSTLVKTDFDPYKTTALRNEAQKWLADLEAQPTQSEAVSADALPKATKSFRR